MQIVVQLKREFVRFVDGDFLRYWQVADRKRQTGHVNRFGC